MTRAGPSIRTTEDVASGWREAPISSHPLNFTASPTTRKGGTGRKRKHCGEDGSGLEKLLFVPLGALLRFQAPPHQIRAQHQHRTIESFIIFGFLSVALFIYARAPQGGIWLPMKIAGLEHLGLT